MTVRLCAPRGVCIVRHDVDVNRSGRLLETELGTIDDALFAIFLDAVAGHG